MSIEVGMKCRQVKVIEDYGFDYIGEEFEITKATDSIIMGKGYQAGVCFGIEVSEFEKYFELIVENPIHEKYTLEVLPYKVNWVISNKDKVEFKTVDSEELSLDLILNGNNTIVILNDGSKGIAKCLPSDKYDANKGMNIAFIKALIEHYENELEMLIN